jgi:hypothetical protein
VEETAYNLYKIFKAISLGTYITQCAVIT